MKSSLIHIYLTLYIILGTIKSTDSLIRSRKIRNIVGSNGPKGVSAPLLSDEIDLENIEGVEQLTKLVLIKTDSLPGESDERIDGRYLNSLMETLYTGLRKPFKSVSADILGIFPSFEEIQVKCEKPNLNENLEKDESLIVKRSSYEGWDLDHSASNTDETNLNKVDDKKNETVNIESDSNYIPPIPYKSSLQVCQAVTNDCLSMEDLVHIIPPAITTFDKALVRLCPIMLFRIMNHICHKPSNSLANRNQNEYISASYQAEKIREEVEGIGQNAKKDSITLNTLLRETQILKNLQSSDDLGAKKPQKLHKKLKTQTPYKSNGRLNQGSLQQHGSVDEQLLKIRLKLTEPSIEKVWIFSLLFVILSIVVSMGGLIVLPFVKKTTRRRILTLFEGLAVGGLAGSATLHMFPQAFGLVDENYHKYFWRIFVVFFGIYLCYLCERIIKILKVMRAKIKRRSRASLIDMDLRYGFPSPSREVSKNRSRSSRIFDHDYDFSRETSTNVGRSLNKSINVDHDHHDICEECIDSKYLESRDFRGFAAQGSSEMSTSKSKNKMKKYKEKKSTLLGGKKRRNMFDNGVDRLSADDVTSTNNPTDVESVFSGVGQTNPTRQRVIQCLKSVQRQFSPVYVVQTQVSDGNVPPKDEPRAGRLMRLANHQEGSNKSKKDQSSRLKKNRSQESRGMFAKLHREKKPSMKKILKQRDVETMLYHQRMIGTHGRGSDNLDRGYLQQRLSGVNDVAAERQDQDNAARMSVDTVAWMIVFGDAVLNVIDGLSIGAAFERNILAGISISVAVMLEEVTHRLGTFAVLIRAGMSMQQSLLCTFLSACALFPGLIVGILLSDATEDATPYIFCAAGGIFLYMVSRLARRSELNENEITNS